MRSIKKKSKNCDIMAFAGSLKISDAESEKLKAMIRLLRQKSTDEFMS